MNIDRQGHPNYMPSMESCREMLRRLQVESTRVPTAMHALISLRQLGVNPVRSDPNIADLLTGIDDKLGRICKALEDAPQNGSKSPATRMVGT